ncbi:MULTISPECIES: glycosyltransferase [Cyanophyceae]|uniref:Glycosyltransferase n=1 Tax=Leptolyngbya subtilissima DQ-A4 TaxID=2933933 RepID=A0ABV0K9Q5_9CYAN|nr:glycosyltransferase [Nodosilinea sp. FACHB-141]MBD2110791.1 glycosyltransferase family 4 protein [Nodosilinea sp. FACHB-141]
MTSLPSQTTSSKFHVLTSTKFDFEHFVTRAALGQGPRHTIWQLKERLNAQVHQPDFEDDSLVNGFDKVLSKLIGRPHQWALARQVLAQTNSDDVVYCCGEDAGLPLALLALFKKNRPRLVVNVMCPERWRPKLLLKWFQLHRSIDAFTVNTTLKVQTLRDMLNLGEDGVTCLAEQTDKQFFYPEPGTIEKHRPLIASAGLEQRDYITLANATHQLDLDVKVCAVSPNATSKTRCRIPEQPPQNMEMRYFDWVDLRDLYRSADIAVVSLINNTYAAGLTVLMEAMACRRPVIITKTVGLATEMAEKGLVWGVQPDSPEELKAAIVHVLGHPEEASARAEAAYQHYLENHTSEQHVEQVSRLLQRVANSTTSDQPMVIRARPV